MAWSPAKHLQSLIFVALFYNQQNPPTIIFLLTLTTSLSPPLHSPHKATMREERRASHSHYIVNVAGRVGGSDKWKLFSSVMRHQIFVQVYRHTCSKVQSHRWRWRNHRHFCLPIAPAIVVRIIPRPRSPNTEVWRHQPQASSHHSHHRVRIMHVFMVGQSVDNIWEAVRWS